MDERNVYYRALLEYKNRTEKDKNIRKLCEAIQRSSTDNDFSESVRTYCIIEEDWIQIIEDGMEHVEKAVREERQFIRKEGEVVPIEKLKRVSSATVQHLARHSNLITKEPPEGEDLIPEKLYMAENFSDFTVYENRFLYMLLCYLRDFINLRLDKILELGRTYRVHTEIQKNVRIGKKHIQYKTVLQYEDKNDSLTDEFFSASPLIARIETAQRLVVSLLMTPLMKEVSKAPMITPPITRTNVLRMNVHFKAALEMYGKLVAYTKPGYVIQEVKTNYRPLPEPMLAECAEGIGLETFLSYKYGNKLSEDLRKHYEEEKKREREQEILEREAKIFAMKKRLAEGGKTLEEYVLLLEEQNRQREKDSVELRTAKKEISQLNQTLAQKEEKINALTVQTETLTKTVQEREKELVENAKKYEEGKQTLLREFAQEKQKMRDEFTQEKQLMQDEFAQEKQQMAERFVEEKEQALKEHKDLAALAVQEKEEIQEKMRLVEEEGVRIKKEDVLVRAQLHGLRQKHGLITDEDDFTSKERFLELEEELIAFQQLFDENWRKTKKRIRKDILWTPPKH